MSSALPVPEFSLHCSATVPASAQCRPSGPALQCFRPVQGALCASWRTTIMDVQKFPNERVLPASLLRNRKPLPSPLEPSQAGKSTRAVSCTGRTGDGAARMSGGQRAVVEGSAGERAARNGRAAEKQPQAGRAPTGAEGTIDARGQLHRKDGRWGSAR